MAAKLIPIIRTIITPTIVPVIDNGTIGSSITFKCIVPEKAKYVFKNSQLSIDYYLLPSPLKKY